MPQTKSARYSLEMLKGAPASSSVASTGFRRVIRTVSPVQAVFLNALELGLQSSQFVPSSQSYPFDCQKGLPNSDHLTVDHRQPRTCP
jgi:hypothetical protein